MKGHPRPRRPFRALGLAAFIAAGMLAAPAGYAAGDCSELFDPGQVLDFHVTMDPADWEALRYSCPGGLCGPKPYLYYPAQFRCEDGPTVQVGIRRKGGKADPSDDDPQKPALKIDFNEFAPEQTFSGKTKLSLENGAEGALVAEGLAWLVHGQAGVVAGRAAWANVYVNGEHKGLFVNVEQVDKTFLADRGIDNGGWIFKVSEQRTREGEPNPYAFNWYPFDHAPGGMDEPTPPDWRDQAGWRVDMAQLLALAAIESYIANTDGLVGDMHNFFYYDWAVFPDGQQPRLYLPWDLDTTMRNGRTTLSILIEGRGHLREGLLVDDPAFQARYLDTFAGLLAGPLALSETLALIDTVEAAVAPHVDTDPFQGPGAGAAEFQRIREFFNARTAFLLGELGTCPDGTCGPGEGACNCAADCGAAPATESACADGVDGDCDGLADCADGDCATDPFCADASQVNDVRITEILANTAGGTDIEYVELRNLGPGAQDLTGWYLIDDNDAHDRCQLSGTLDAGAYLVVAGDAALFVSRWDVPDLNPDTFNDGPTGGFALGNGGDQVRLYRPTPQGDQLVHGFRFGLQGVDVPFGLVPENAAAPEYLAFPTPGGDNALAGFHSLVCINEFQTTSAAGGVDDWIELYNRGGTAVDISGWQLSDDAAAPGRFTFPAGTTLLPGQHLVTDETALGFSLSSTGSEVIQLSRGDGITGQDYFDYGPQFPDVTTGRLPDGASNWVLLQAPSPGASNACRPGPVEALRFEGPNELAWQAVAGAQAYDLVRGDLGLLRAAAGDYAAAVEACQADDLASNGAPVAIVPPEGVAYFFLARAESGPCQPGSWNTLDGTEVASRDESLSAAAAGCP